METQLRKDIRDINKNKPNQGKDHVPVIHRNLNKYVRQYIGFIDEDGQRVIHVNFFWNHYSLWEISVDLQNLTTDGKPNGK